MEEVSTTEVQEVSSLPSAPSLIEEARKEREAIEKGLAEIKKQKAEMEQMHARMILGGSALAGSKIEPPKTEEQLLEEQAEQMAKDAAKRLLGTKGIGFNG